MLAHYSNLFSAPNFEKPFIIIVLQYAPKYYQNPLPKHFIVSQPFYIRTSPAIRMITGINTQ